MTTLVETRGSGIPFPRNRPVWTVAVLAVCLAGCGGPEGEPGGAPGAPIKVPSLSGAGGRPVSEVHPELVKRVKEQCGGQMCVNVVVRYEKKPGAAKPVRTHGAALAGAAPAPCGFRRPEPASGQTVQRGGTIYVWADPPDVESPVPRPCGVEETVTAEPPGQSTAPTEESPAPTGDGSPSGQSPGPTGDLTPTEEDTVPEQPEDGDEVPEPEPPPEEEPT